MKKHRSRTTASTSLEQMAITYNSLSALQPNKDFRAPLEYDDTQVLTIGPFLHREQGG